ncbi:MAG: class I SAM-dependent methyltransferase [Nocardioides sp.]|uniref:class I SAM-dependent methyltransferase n=1 Tax=Nocardioides sp. TaxID=35761 RepID=UPI003F1035AF
MEQTAEQLAERVLGSVIGAFDVYAIHLGDRMGWYRSLAREGPADPATLAERTGTQERYAREWLEHQAVAGLLEVADPGPDGQRCFGIGAATAEVFTDPHSLSFMAPFARMAAAVGPALPLLLDAYRHGGGVSWDQLGDDAREAQADGNRPWFESRLTQALASVPEVADVLARPGVRVLEVGCGGGWASIALASAHPGAHVTGVDVDAPSVAMAVRHAEEAGVPVTFRTADAADLGEEVYDLALALECVHDMPRPVEVLRAVRSSLVPGGSLVVMDEAVAPSFAPDGDDLERIMYGFSLCVCLPDSLSSPPSVGTGTVMRPDTLRAYALEAGFTGFEVLPIDDFGFWRFYRLS